MIDGFELSEHARFQMQERNIQPSWLTQTLSAPIGFCPWPICMATPITLSKSLTLTIDGCGLSSTQRLILSE
jgi:hypothetical protein